MTLSELLDKFVENDQTSLVYAVGDEFMIIENPSFSILPNHPYRSPLAVVVYCTAGSAKGRINTKFYNLKKEAFMILQPGQITEMIGLSDDFRAIYIIMSASFTHSLGIGNTFSLSKIVASSPYIQLEGQSKEAFESYISMCRNIIPIDSNPNRLEILKLLTRAFFLGMGYFLHDTGRRIESRSEEHTNSFIALVEQYYAFHRDLEFYARKLNITTKHLSKTVKMASGKSATEWIEKYVILDAVSMLLSSNISIKEIAYRLNFPSQSCFGKYFYRIMAMSPMTYRISHRH